MNDNISRIIDLLEKHLKDELDEQEMQELESWKNQSEDNRKTFELLTDNNYLFKAISDNYSENSTESVRQKINKLIEADEKGEAKVVQPHWFTRRKMMPAAAAIFILLAGLSYILIQNKKTETISFRKPQTAINDKAPGRDGAILKLATGQQIVLDNAGNGTVAQQGNASITKQGDLLAYNSAGNNSEILYNTLSTPVGRKFQLILPDGSRVWLNASSYITYPTAFAGKERQVTISGEVYMEVAKDATKPFIVRVLPPAPSMKETMVQVLGTHFNINGYGDDGLVKTTLVEGKVKVTDGSSIAVLKPGQQAQAGASKIAVENNADIQKELAWRGGLFNFGNEKLKTIMPQIGRWYDVDVVYESDDVKNIVITGKIERTANLSEVLELLSYLKINHRIEGRKLILKGQ